MLDNIPDNLDMHNRYDRKMSRLLERLPKCSCCENPIQQEKAVRIDGKWYCDECLDNYFRQVVEDVFR